MATRLSLKPQDIGRNGVDGWYYEDRRGIGIYNAAGFYARIPWKTVARSVDRWRREKRRLAKKRAAKR